MYICIRNLNLRLWIKVTWLEYYIDDWFFSLSLAKANLAGASGGSRLARVHSDLGNSQPRCFVVFLGPNVWSSMHIHCGIRSSVGLWQGVIRGSYFEMLSGSWRSLWEVKISMKTTTAIKVSRCSTSKTSARTFSSIDVLHSFSTVSTLANSCVRSSRWQFQVFRW